MNDALERNDFIIDSHRGAFKGGMLENSIPAFQEAVDEGANVLECDIRGTKDGDIALVHNRSIDHVASHAIKVPEMSEFNEGPTGKVGDHTMEYLRALNYEHGAKLINLGEFLDFLSEARVGAQIELKEFHFNAKIVECLQSMDLDHDELKGPIVFTSFNPFAVLSLRKAILKANLPMYDAFAGRKGYALGLQAIALGAFYGPWVLRRCKKNRIWGFMTYYKYLPISRIEYAHKRLVKFCPRVPNDEKLVLSYINANVDGFETDSVPFIISCIEKAGYSWKK